MWFVLLDDVDTDDGCQFPGKVLSQDQMQYLVSTSDCIKSVAFFDEEGARYYAEKCMN